MSVSNQLNSLVRPLLSNLRLLTQLLIQSREWARFLYCSTFGDKSSFVLLTSIGGHWDADELQSLKPRFTSFDANCTYNPLGYGNNVSGSPPSRYTRGGWLTRLVRTSRPKEGYYIFGCCHVGSVSLCVEGVEISVLRLKESLEQRTKRDVFAFGTNISHEGLKTPYSAPCIFITTMRRIPLAPTAFHFY